MAPEHETGIGYKGRDEDPSEERALGAERYVLTQ